jgi:DNA-binding PadR family transcriptional regulator
MALRHAVLISLQSEEATGYEIAKWFDCGMGYFWHASHQQIYLELGKMTKAGLVDFREIEQTGKPAKKVYRVTKEGMKALEEWLLKPAKQFVIKDELLMKVYAGHLTPPAHLLAEVQVHKKDYQALLKTFQEIESQWFSKPKELPLQQQYIHFTLKNGIYYAQAWLKWCDELIEFLQQQTD